MITNYQKLLFAVFVTISILLTACKRDSRFEKPKIIYGQVEFIIKNNVTLESIYQTILQQGIDNYLLSNFYYTKTIPADSMLYYHYLFLSQPYVTNFNVFKKTGDTFTRFNGFVFQNFSDNNFIKWDSIVVHEHLIEMPDAGDGYNRSGLIYITYGQEKIWIDRLKSLPEIKSADYVYEYIPEF